MWTYRASRKKQQKTHSIPMSSHAKPEKPSYQASGKQVAPGEAGPQCGKGLCPLSATAAHREDKAVPRGPLGVSSVGASELPLPRRWQGHPFSDITGRGQRCGLCLMRHDCFLAFIYFQMFQQRPCDTSVCELSTHTPGMVS